MKKVHSEQKVRAVSDSSEKKKQQLDPDQQHFRERSFTDVFAVFSKKQKVTKKDAATNTIPLDELYARPTLPPAVPPKINHYYLNKALNKVDTDYEDVHKGDQYQWKSSMNVEPCLWTTLPTGETQNQETPEEENGDNTDHKEQEVVDEQLNMTTHKRNTSEWSLGSFRIGTPVKLMSDLLTGEEWAQFFENNLKFPPDTNLSASDEPDRSICDFEAKQKIPMDAVDGKTMKERSKSVGSDIEDILTTVKIISPKVEVPEVLMEEPEPPHILPPKLTSCSEFGIDKRFRSSVFYRYKLPPPGQDIQPGTPRSGYSTLDKIKAKLRKLSVEEAQLKEAEK